MKFLKCILSAVLAIGFVFSFVACENNNAKNTATTIASSTATTVADTSAISEQSNNSRAITQAANDNVVTEYFSDHLTDEFERDARPPTSPPEINAKSVILMEQSTGKVLYENNADEVIPPASITKIMTMLLVSEAIEKGTLSLTDIVYTSEHAAAMSGSRIGIKPNETSSVDDLLKAVAVGAANDACVALAEHIAGSEEGFVTMMNEKAKQLGMKNTVFKNACGLDADGHVSTARDVAIMSRELLNHSVIRGYTNIWMYSLRDGEIKLVNTNKLVRFYLGATGLMTGTTDKSGACISASAKKFNMELIVVIMGGTDSEKRFADATRMLNFGFWNF